MKTSLITLAFALVSSLVLAQTATENYVKSTTYKKPVKDQAEINALDNFDKVEKITYLDGLGRPKQSIAKQAGGDRQDIIVPFVYDDYGRQVKEYLPYTNTTQGFGTSHLNYRNHTQLLIDLEDYYVNKYADDQITSTTINAYSEKQFENSPLNRVLKQSAPGADWAMGQGHEIELGYQSNTSTEVKLYLVTLSVANKTYTPSLAIDGNYSAGELYKSIIKDENYSGIGKDHTTEEFTNSQGQVILKRTYDNEVTHDTYYVYDDYGNLTYVLPPKAEADANIPTSSELSELCYQYVYDNRNRLVEKKIPGKDWEYIVYNKLNQPVLTQDANLRVDDKWLFTKYDAFGRVVYTGIYRSTISRTAMQTNVDSHTVLFESRTTSLTTLQDGTTAYYTNVAYPNSGTQIILTINYYDDYNWDTINSFEANYDLDYQSGLFLYGNEIIKIASSGWNAGFTTEGEISGEGYIQWTIPSTDYRLMVGLSRTNSAPDDNFNTIDFAIDLHSTNNRVHVFEEGVYQSFVETYFQAGDVFRVERIGNQIHYIKNDITFHVSSVLSTGTLIGDSSFYHTDAVIEDMFIGYSTQGQAYTNNATGLATGAKIRTIDGSDWTRSEMYYDDKGRPIYTTSNNDYLDVNDVVSSRLDFTGNTIINHSTHILDGQGGGASKPTPIVVTDKYSYDHSGRLLRQTQKVNNENYQLIAKNNYDEIGQLEQKQVGGELPSISAYVNNTGLTVSGNTITKTLGDGWNAGLSTQKVISGDGYISFKTTSTKAFMAGLSYSDINLNQNSIDYAIYITWGISVYVYENGVNKGIKTNHAIGDEFSVERRENTILYIKNGVPFYTSTVSSPTLTTMVGDLSMYYNTMYIKDFVLVDLEKELQEVDYTYNIRGWLKEINDIGNLGSDLFGFDINYNGTIVGSGNGDQLYNGNISQIKWKTLNDNIKRGYRFEYDALNRLKAAYSRKGSGLTVSDQYSMWTVYDKNGNLTRMNRTGHTDQNATTFGTMDDLYYTYEASSNKLIKVSDNGNHTYGFKDDYTGTGTDPSNDYAYDNNGNMISDTNKNISSITYNHLNLPKKVTFGIGKDITYEYDASGIKLSKKVNDGSNITYTIYAGNYIYEKPNALPSSIADFKFFSHPEGYVEYDGKYFNYTYQYKDHLGNIRLAYSDSNDDGSVSTSEIIEENNYYPFGAKHKGYNSVVSANSNSSASKFKYNGKELQEDLGWDMYDYGARNYDPWTGRWNQIDPLAAKYNEYSPYNYVLNNPVLMTDPDGKDPIDPRTGKPYKLNLWRDGIISYDKDKSNLDADLLREATPKAFFNSEGFDEPRKRDGGFRKSASHIHDSSFDKTSEGAKEGIAKILGIEKYADEQPFTAPHDSWWRSAAKSGTYTFENSSFAESEWFYVDEQSYNIIQVEDNMISQITNLTLNDDNEFDISSVTSFSVDQGEIKTRTIKRHYGLTFTEKYRTSTVTETTQNYTNNKASGDATSKTYTTEEIIR